MWLLLFSMSLKEEINGSDAFVESLFNEKIDLLFSNLDSELSTEVGISLNYMDFRTKDMLTYDITPRSRNNSRVVILVKPNKSKLGEWSAKGSLIYISASKKKLRCWGLLADPLETNSVQKMAAHIQLQIPEIKERLRIVQELENLRCSLNNEEWSDFSYEEIDKRRNRRVVSASGVGKKSEKRLIQMFGVPSNILLYGLLGIESCVSTAWGNDPDVKKVYKQVFQAVKLFKKFEKEGNFSFEYSLSDLTDYPKTPVYGKQSYRTPHTSERIDFSIIDIQRVQKRKKKKELINEIENFKGESLDVDKELFEKLDFSTLKGNFKLIKQI